ncbi:DNA-3-methyladenine glycosylase I [Flavicella sediminum]|uniref:DNA-3-methyladenine glycosylase I n=1 Tax=Flavicella sediminum TaxID=2585141 RepID=UPI00111DD67E|nr:DNA-3-methyladenine glycosylase I [Flavicella sediminum]
MEKPNSYCEFVASLDKDNLHRIYHDNQYGYPIHSDDELFCRLILEINQAGLSWTTILKKQENFRKAFSNFNINQVANYTDVDIQRLLSDTGIIRNKLKINATIFNAKKIIELQKEHGSFKNWLDQQFPLQIEDWVKLFKKTFKFTGGEITKEFLKSTGYIPGAHISTCETNKLVLISNPMWIKKD